LIFYIEGYFDGHSYEAREEIRQYIGPWVYEPETCGAIPSTLTKADVLGAGKKVIVWDNMSRDCSATSTDAQYNYYVYTGLGSIAREFEDQTTGSWVAGKGSFLSNSDIRDHFLAGVNLVNLDFMHEGEDDRLAAGVWSWNTGEPNNAGGNEDCAFMQPGGRWNDAACSASRRYACRDAGGTWRLTSASGPWEQGAAACESELGGTFTFATPANVLQNSALQAVKGASTSVWLSSNDLAVEGQWTSDVYLWEEGEPNNWNEEDCAASRASGRFNDDDCRGSSHPFACRDSSGAWYVTSGSGPWYGGEDLCASETGGAYAFAVPRTWGENEALKSAKAAAGESTVWVAYNDSADEGDWQSKYVLYDTAVGGGGGAPFDIGHLANKKVELVQIRTGARVDMVSFRYQSGEWMKFGGDGGTNHVMWLAADEKITYAKACTGSSHDEVDYVRFETNLGRILEGGNIPSSYICKSTRADEITAMHGRSGARVDKLGFIYK
jgi:Lectin C-type domain